MQLNFLGVLYKFSQIYLTTSPDWIHLGIFPVTYSRKYISGCFQFKQNRIVITIFLWKLYRIVLCSIKKSCRHDLFCLIWKEMDIYFYLNVIYVYIHFTLYIARDSTANRNCRIYFIIRNGMKNEVSNKRWTHKIHIKSLSFARFKLIIINYLKTLSRS